MTRAPAKPKTRLAAVQRARLHQPLRFLFTGVEGVGKSTLAAHAPNGVCFDLEGGSNSIPMARYPFRVGEDGEATSGGHVPQTLQEVRSGIEDLLGNQHAFEHLIIDTVDSLEALIFLYLCRRDNKQSIEDYGFKAGYEMAFDEWRRLWSSLEMLRIQRGMSIILLSHTMVRPFRNPEGDDYDRYQMCIHHKAAAFLRKQCDLVGFCAFEGGTGKVKQGNRGPKAYVTGKRFVYFERSAAYDAKSRESIPPRLELTADDPWAPLAQAIGLGRSAEGLRERITTLTGSLGDRALAKNVEVAVQRAGDDTAKLYRFLTELQSRRANQEASK